MRYNLVIFDCDGTLVDSEPVTMKLIAQMMLEMGVSKEPSELYDMFAGKNMSFITDFVESQIGLFDKISFEQDYRKRCVTMFEQELLPIPGVKNLVQSLQVPTCVASNGPHEKMDITLAVTGLDRSFTKDRIFSAYDIQKWKPDPALINYVLDKMNCRAQDAVLIEDTMSGIQAGLNANVDTLAYNPHQIEEISQCGVMNFASMEDIKSYLENS